MQVSCNSEPASDNTDPFVKRFKIEPYKSGSLSGTTFAVKDLIDIAGERTACGNPFWRDRHPAAAANAVCVEQLLAAGATCLGKTLTDELAFDLLGENHFFGTAVNPADPRRVPGGSSSGSASAVARGDVDFALGTDTGGSIRVPASNCGIFGFRPSHGRVSVAGVNPLAPSSDTVGILAKNAEILVKSSAVLIAEELPEQAEVKRLLIAAEAWDIVEEAVREALQEPLQKLSADLDLRGENFSLSEFDPDSDSTTGGELLKNWLAAFRNVQGAEIWSCLGSWIESNQDASFGPRIAKNFEYASTIDRELAAEHIAVRERIYRRCNQVLGDGDLLCIPTVPAPAPMKGTIGPDRFKSDYMPRAVSLTSIAGLCRLPQVTLPVATVEQGPIGISILGRNGADANLLAAALKYSRCFCV